MSESGVGWSALRRAGQSALFAAWALGFGMAFAIAEQGQEVPKMPPKSAAKAGTGDQTTWVKICTKDDKSGGKQFCLVKHEGLEPKTGTILIAAAVRTIEGEDKQHLLVNVPTDACRRANHDRRWRASSTAIFSVPAYEPQAAPPQ
jgi:invasion protein IalB